jgi:hypothetical protein
MYGLDRRLIRVVVLGHASNKGQQIAAVLVSLAKELAEVGFEHVEVR